jgi:hypothetical protein
MQQGLERRRLHHARCADHTDVAKACSTEIREFSTRSAARGKGNETELARRDSRDEINNGTAERSRRRRRANSITSVRYSAERVPRGQREGITKDGYVPLLGPSWRVTMAQASPAREIGLVSGKIFTFRFRFKRGGAAR